jgi:uncharacterized protein YhbP (UPF0306 family)
MSAEMLNGNLRISIKGVPTGLRGRFYKGKKPMTEEELKQGIRLRLDSQSFAILSTNSDNNPPHSTIVCFVHADNLSTLVFVTPDTTRKYENMISNPKITLFVDDRSLFLGDLRDIWGIEARGCFRLPEESEKDGYRNLFLRKYPDLTEFADAGSSAWCLLEVESYDVVRKFQNVFKFTPGAP